MVNRVVAAFGEISLVTNLTLGNNFMQLFEVPLQFFNKAVSIRNE